MIFFKNYNKIITIIEHDNLNLEKAKHKREKLEKFIKTNIETLPKFPNEYHMGVKRYYRYFCEEE